MFDTKEKAEDHFKDTLEQCKGLEVDQCEVCEKWSIHSFYGGEIAGPILDRKNRGACMFSVACNTCEDLPREELKKIYEEKLSS